MNDSSNLDTTIYSSISDMNDNDFCKTSVFAGQMHIDGNVAKWSIVHFETDEEENVEDFNDLIPSSWITTTGKLCWYPMDENQATIYKLVKQCAKVDPQWNCFSIKTIEKDIEKYEQGMKMLVKISKNPNATLYSDIEERGKGKRLKKPIKHFDDSNKENNIKTKRNIQSIPPFPKLANVSKAAQANQPLPVKVDKIIKRSCIDKASSSSDNAQQLFYAHDINVPWEISKQKGYMECKEAKPLKERSFPLEMCKSAAITSDNIFSSHEILPNDKGFKLSSTIHSKSTYISEREITLESLAYDIGYLKAEMLSCKLILRKIDRNVESFLETQTMVNKYTSEKSTGEKCTSEKCTGEKCTGEKCTSENTCTTIHVLDEFPLTNLTNLEKIESKLKNDANFYSNVVNALHFGVMGQSLQRKINYILRMVLDDKLATLFNWKGQRGTKLKLSKSRIAKIMIEAVAKEFPTINEITFGRKAGPWLAQATFRIKKHNSKNEEAVGDNSEILSGEDEDSSANDENNDEADNDKRLQ